jgi:hypothetical protein
MRTRNLIFLILLMPFNGLFSQTNMAISNPEAEQILLGNYNPANYLPPVIINQPDSILNGIINRVSKDTLVKYLMKIDSYHNRNTGSDTVSNSRGIGAVRRWIHQKFNEYRGLNQNRLVTTYLDFDASVCLQTHHRNVMAVLPGLDTTNKDILVLEGHFDTRCQGVCDTACYSPGMEDNGSGTVLVMELARIMSHYAFNHTIVFACVTGEDQGLYGSTALSAYLKNNNIQLRACFNNDVVGGVICGMTSSPPSCPGFNAIDSTHVRVFSYSLFNDSASVSPHKQLARYIRLHQDEKINPLISTPMTIDIMLWEDRSGRSGDQVPFRLKGYTAVRFCSKNEHGNGQGIPPDRQHTSDDILGLDLTVPPDGVIDSFYVDPNYLRRNIISNGVNLGYLAIAPPSPHPDYVLKGDTLEITFHGADTVYKHYRVGIRTKKSGSLYFDTIYTFTNTDHLVIPGILLTKTNYVSVANVLNTVESLFSDEFAFIPVTIEGQVHRDWGIILRQNQPNPFENETEIFIETGPGLYPCRAEIIITTLTGSVLSRLPVDLRPGMNTVTYSHPSHLKGMLFYSLSLEGNIISTRKMAVM